MGSREASRERSSRSTTHRHYRDRDSSEKYSRRDRARNNDSERRRRRRRSHSPHSMASNSRGFKDDRSGKSRSSRSPKDESRKRRSRYSEDKKRKQVEDQVAVRRGGALPSQADSFAVSNGDEPEKPKEKANFGNTGLLAAASNSVVQMDGTTITLKYHEPPESRKPPPRDQWKLFVFKGEDVVDTIELSTRSCWLVGREATIVDLLAENPSISKQHAVIQFRYTEKRNEYGDKIGRVKPYLLDLESANRTKLNGEEVPDRRYLELRPKDVIKFGSSEREYVVMLSRD
ncbi:SMAD/FHA domain-containing protein [Coniella lustricola]|uniref:SMAD/FHA domain-containing protein n=1 Tax=Coniella lustricola TaxID=2025994 RepID=A0A2T3AHN3_9PEZI|nr:SMAD/FHA domain-containing protein [Coniella lustricola]